MPKVKSPPTSPSRGCAADPSLSPAFAAERGKRNAMTNIDISRLMRPRSIAIVGISPEPSSAGFLMLKTLEEYSYSGAIHLVSRNRSDINGRPCVKTIEDLPEGIDAAMLLIPRVAIEDAVKSCARKKI